MPDRELCVVVLDELRQAHFVFMTILSNRPERANRTVEACEPDCAPHGTDPAASLA